MPFDTSAISDPDQYAAAWTRLARDCRLGRVAVLDERLGWVKGSNHCTMGWIKHGSDPRIILEKRGNQRLGNGTVPYLSTQKPSKARPTQLTANIEPTIAAADASVATALTDRMTRTLCRRRSDPVRQLVLNNGEIIPSIIMSPTVAALLHRRACCPKKPAFAARSVRISEESSACTVSRAAAPRRILLR